MNKKIENICPICGLDHIEILANGLRPDESRRQFLRKQSIGEEKFEQMIKDFTEIIKKYNLDSQSSTFSDVIDEIKYLTLHKFI